MRRVVPQYLIRTRARKNNRKTIPPNNMAVDKLPTMISPQTTTVHASTIMKYFFWSCSVRIRLNKSLTTRIRVSLANSEGWNVIPKIRNQRFAPLISTPILVKVSSRNTIEIPKPR